MDILDALSRRPTRPPHHDAARAGRGVHGRRPRPPDRTGRRRDGDPGAGRNEPRDRRRRRVSSTGRRWSPSPARPRSDKLHKEAHQVVDIVRMMEPVTKWNTRVERVEAIPEIVRKAFRVATLEKPGPTHIELPEDVAATASPRPTPVARAAGPRPSLFPRAHGRGHRPCGRPPRRIGTAHRAGRQRRPPPARPPDLRALARGLHVPVAATFMGKGAIDDRSHLSLMAVGLQARDHVLSGFDRADLVVCVGYDLVEYAPSSWNPDGAKRIIHIDTQPAEIDAAYQPEVELDRRHRRDAPAPARGGPAPRHRRPRRRGTPRVAGDPRPRRPAHRAARELAAHENDDAWPITPQRAIADLRRALAPEDIVVSDVGAHKVWVARLYQAYEPNTVIIRTASRRWASPSRGDRVTLGMYLEKRLSAAQRRFTSSLGEMLARVRKLSRNTPALQFNIATSGGQQVNLTK